jgi:hypothetical protein
VRHTAVEELARCWSDDPDIAQIFKKLACSDKDSKVRLAALAGLRRTVTADPEIQALLQKEMRDAKAIRKLAVPLDYGDWVFHKE